MASLYRLPLSLLQGLTERSLSIRLASDHGDEPSLRDQQKIWPAFPRRSAYIMARVYGDVNQQMPRAYWDYDSVNISWGVLENYEVVRKIGTLIAIPIYPQLAKRQH